jgi:hypothetical protein
LGILIACIMYHQFQAGAKLRCRSLASCKGID